MTSVRVSSDQLQAFEPLRLGSRSGEFRDALQEIHGKPQSAILVALEDRARAITEATPDVETQALRVALLVLRDYVVSGYYPIIQNGRCFLANVSDAATLTEDQKRKVLRHRYQAARQRALRDRGQSKWLQDLSGRMATQPNVAHEVIHALGQAPPQTRLVDTRAGGEGDLGVRGLWRAVRATWSMGPEASAPGRENAFLVTDARWPDCPLGILQFRNVVPEIGARDRWLGVAAGKPEGGTRANGFLGLLMREPAEATNRARLTLDLLQSLLAHVRTEGISLALVEGNITALQDLARLERVRFNESRAEAPEGKTLENLHLLTVKRAQTAAALLRGIRVLKRIVSKDLAIENMHDSDVRDLDVGLGKIWHFHMGFVALEMSICGASPPFGPLRVGKLAATLAGSEEVVMAWGADRPLGAIAKEVYHQEVRETVPNPGPLVVFTSGLFPGHSAQYNRVVSGSTAWTKIGETSGYGSFHISPETVAAMRGLNDFVDGYEHITRTFGEGSGARFRSVGKALALLGLPDFRKHETKRPLYALPLVDNPQAVLLGWEPAKRTPRPSTQELADQWWTRWVADNAAVLAARARIEPDLASAVIGIAADVSGLG